MNEFNKRTAMNYQLRTGLEQKLQQDAQATRKQQRLAKYRIAGRHFATAIRRQNRLIVLDLSLAAAALTALGVLIGCVVG